MAKVTAGSFISFTARFGLLPAICLKPVRVCDERKNTDIARTESINAPSSSILSVISFFRVPITE